MDEGEEARGRFDLGGDGEDSEEEEEEEEAEEDFRGETRCTKGVGREC